MQESGCDPSRVGGAGEQGLMQITPDKCGNAPNGNCQDIVRFFWLPLRRLRDTILSLSQDYNIKTGAEYFANLLATNNGDTFITIGQYNGWYPGMTYVRIITYI